MNSSEGLKRLLYSQFLHFTHLTEKIFTTESEEFANFARLEGLSSFPANLTSVHTIDCIGHNEPINNTSIAEKMKLSKASITKISNKLLEEGFIKRSQMNDNKKEVYFSLTPKGRQIFEVHAMMHVIIENRFIDLMSVFSESELQAVLKFFHMMIQHYDKSAKGGE
ncbi:MarR family transcriptional regulator [Paenibacillus sp. CN-4]|uniref:MarR family transcriptional regulator n=1 Tax=Paenibacillus nanchangensis TaxID=3348343 RepID=UPI00397A4979